MQSMTGFGHAEVEIAGLRIVATTRSVNHRYLDLALRLKEDQRPQESALREHLGQRLARGRVEVSFEVEPLGQAPAEVEIDHGLATAVKEAAQSLVSAGVLDEGPTFGDLMRIPDVVRVRSQKVAWDDESKAALVRALDAALDQLLAARATEGAKLASVLEAHLEALGKLTDELRACAEAWPATAASHLRARLDTLLEGVDGPDPDRVAQEVALLADRSDVREELDRLGSHLEHFRSLMAKPGAIGKRLDFLAQEIFRELNTTGSKCRDATMTRLVLDGKSRCEQIREQVQNVE